MFPCSRPRHAWTAPHMVSVLVTPPAEPLTLAEGKLRAGLDWAGGDPRDALMLGFIAAARQQVERDTGLALLTQTRDVYLDALPRGPITLPDQSTPLQSVTSVTSRDASGAAHVLAVDQYVVDIASGRIALAPNGAWPTDLQSFQPWTIRIVSGWLSAAALPPLLLHAVGLLTGYFATVGRDVATVGTIIAQNPHGYDDCIAPFRRVSLI